MMERARVRLLQRTKAAGLTALASGIIKRLRDTGVRATTELLGVCQNPLVGLR